MVSGGTSKVIKLPKARPVPKFTAMVTVSVPAQNSQMKFKSSEVKKISANLAVGAAKKKIKLSVASSGQPSLP